MKTNTTNYLQVDYGEIERRNTITFGEFKCWLRGLIEGKRGVIPDIEDWKRIKQMMDKVVIPENIKYVPALPVAPVLYPLYPPGVHMYPTTPPQPTTLPWITYSTNINGAPPSRLTYDTTKTQKLEFKADGVYKINN